MIQQQNPQAQQPTPEPDVEPAASRYRFKHRGAKAALDYLKRHGLQGNPLRTTTQEQST